MRKLLGTLPLLCFLPLLLPAQEEIPLSNPSFEDRPHIGVKGNSFFEARSSIRDWADCGFPDESPPDIHADNASDTLQQRGWQVKMPSQEGETFLGLVVRDNSTYESVGQPLAVSLEGGSCYEFSIHLCRSNSYVSESRTTGEFANFTNPTVLRVWGGYSPCDRRQMLDETPPINHAEWKTYRLKLEPNQDYTHIVLEAFYKTPTLFPYNGHVLVDNASGLRPIPCPKEIPDEPVIPGEQPIAYESTVPQERINRRPPPKNSPSSPEMPATPSTGPKEETEVRSTPPTKNKTPKESIMGLDRTKMRKGETIRIKKLLFKADSDEIQPESYEVLDEIFVFLKENPDLIVELGGHTNTLADAEYAATLSLSRAEAIAKYLVQKGIDQERLQSKGYGKTKPIIANDKYSRYAQQKNQRVEIKILNMDEER